MSGKKGTSENDVEIARIQAEAQKAVAELYAQMQADQSESMAEMMESIGGFKEGVSDHLAQYLPHGGAQAGGAIQGPCCHS